MNPLVSLANLCSPGTHRGARAPSKLDHEVLQADFNVWHRRSSESVPKKIKKINRTVPPSQFMVVNLLSDIPCFISKLCHHRGANLSTLSAGCPLIQKPHSSHKVRPPGRIPVPAALGQSRSKLLVHKAVEEEKDNLERLQVSSSRKTPPPQSRGGLEL